MPRQYDSKSSLHEKILKGVDTLANNVASTLGPRGRNVILYQKGVLFFHLLKDFLHLRAHTRSPTNNMATQILLLLRPLAKGILAEPCVVDLQEPPPH